MAPLRDLDILNLPEAPEFMKNQTPLSPQEHLALCEQMLPVWNAERLRNPPPLFLGEAFRFLEEDEDSSK